MTDYLAKKAGAAAVDPEDYNTVMDALNDAQANALPAPSDEGDVLTVVSGEWAGAAPSGGSQPVVVLRVPITPATTNIFTEIDLGYTLQEGDLIVVNTSVTEAWDGDSPKVYVYCAGDDPSTQGIQQQGDLSFENSDSSGTSELSNWALGAYIEIANAQADLKAVVLVASPGNPTEGAAEIIAFIFPANP